MNFEFNSFLEAATILSLGMVVASMVVTFARLVRGPSLPDRVIALDLFGLCAVGFVAAYDIAVEQVVLLDASIVIALLSFLGTIGFAHYVQRRPDQWPTS